MKGFVMIELGDKVKDKITGFEGICISLNTWLHGCDRVGVESTSLHEGKPQDVQWFDVYRVEVIEAGVFASLKVLKETVSDQALKKPGGPRQDPKRVASPK